MIGSERAGHDLGREAFGTAAGLAIVVGALAVVARPFDALTGTLTVLAVAGWASTHRRSYGGLATLGRSPGAYAVAFGVLGAAAVLFAETPPSFVPWRGLLLGLAIVPLWGTERRRGTAGLAPARTA